MSDPTAISVVRYRCPYCRKSWSSRSAAEAHIARCWYNPEVRGCKTCVHFFQFESDTDVESCEECVSLKDGLNTYCEKWTPKEDSGED